jgi:flagellar hook-associated protein 3 FlgL
MRITTGMDLNFVLQAESVSQQQLATLTQQASSGLRVQNPSDDPAAYATIVQDDAQISSVQARSSVCSQANGDLTTASDALDQAATILQQAQSIAVEAANGTQDAASRAASGQQVASLMQQLVAIGNTKGSSGYLFGGTATNAPPFDSTGTFSGNATVTYVQIADGVTAQSNASGADAFTAAGGQDVFAAMQALQTALAGNDVPGIQSSITSLQTSHDQVVAAEVQTGESAATLQSAGQTMTTMLTQLRTSLAGVQDADATSTFTELAAAQNSYQEALQVNQRILSLTVVTGS